MKFNGNDLSPWQDGNPLHNYLGVSKKIKKLIKPKKSGKNNWKTKPKKKPIKPIKI
jgi:hypothetical protein